MPAECELEAASSLYIDNESGGLWEASGELLARELPVETLMTWMLRSHRTGHSRMTQLRACLGGHYEELAIQQVLLDIGFTATVEIISAHADWIRVHIPWAKLLSKSTRLVMGTLTVWPCCRLL
eukprot:s3633_g3.t1